MAPASQCSDLGLPTLRLQDYAGPVLPAPPNWAVALSQDITVQLQAAGLVVDPAALRFGIENCWPSTPTALPDVAVHLPTFPGLARPAASTPLCPAAWGCPFGCPGMSWSGQQSCVNHIDLVHLQQGADPAWIAVWMVAAKKEFCKGCRLLVPAGYSCKRCRVRPCQGAGSSGSPARVEPSLADDPVADDVWKEVVRQALPILRVVPLGSQDPFFSQLGLELDLLNEHAGEVAVFRLAVFCRIVLQPVGRGGRRHRKQVVAVVNGRIARWAAGQYGSLVRE